LFNIGLGISFGVLLVLGIVNLAFTISHLTYIDIYGKTVVALRQRPENEVAYSVS
jgi:hypothetical protein